MERVPKYNLSYIILETEINYQNAVTFVLVKLPRKQLGSTRYLLDLDLSGSVVPTSSRHVITHGLTKGNSIGLENRTV